LLRLKCICRFLTHSFISRLGVFPKNSIYSLFLSFHWKEIFRVQSISIILNEENYELATAFQVAYSLPLTTNRIQRPLFLSWSNKYSCLSFLKGDEDNYEHLEPCNLSFKIIHSIINSDKIHTGESPLKYNVENLSLELIYRPQNWYSA